MEKFISKQLLLALMIAAPTLATADSLPLNLLKLKPGFQISTYAYPVDGARSMSLGKNGTLFVGSRGAGKVYAITPDKKIITIASDLNSPNGVAFKDGDLYVAEIHRVLRFDNIEANLQSPPKPVVINTDLPNKTHHGWRYIKFGPDNKLYIAVGAPCNVCLEQDPKFATIMHMDKDGKNFEVYAHGVRNSVGFDWNPKTRQLWFTDNGRDWMGDNTPPDEINVATKKGQDFGFPYCHGKNIPDPKFGTLFPCSKFVAPAYSLQAHVAALGMTFYTGNMFPATYKDSIFIAEHGSWNRSTPVGYQVVNATISGNNVTNVDPFISGWLQTNGKVWGRPVDVLQMPDGALLISDDLAGAIYRVTYKKKS